MSTSLWWSPPPTEIKWRDISLKYEIAIYLDPEYNGGYVSSFEVDQSIIPFLKGIIAAVEKGTIAHKDAQSLINGIEKYGKVILSIH